MEFNPPFKGLNVRYIQTELIIIIIIIIIILLLLC